MRWQQRPTKNLWRPNEASSRVYRSSCTAKLLDANKRPKEEKIPNIEATISTSAITTRSDRRFKFSQMPSPVWVEFILRACLWGSNRKAATEILRLINVASPLHRRTKAFSSATRIRLQSVCSTNHRQCYSAKRILIIIIVNSGEYYLKHFRVDVKPVGWCDGLMCVIQMKIQNPLLYVIPLSRWALFCLLSECWWLWCLCGSIVCSVEKEYHSSIDHCHRRPPTTSLISEAIWVNCILSEKQRNKSACRSSVLSEKTPQMKTSIECWLCAFWCE